jgi:hypothetical protein
MHPPHSMNAAAISTRASFLELAEEDAFLSFSALLILSPFHWSDR